jgi:MFS family permease
MIDGARDDARAAREQGRVLLVASLSTVLALLAFVTPLATGVRTAAGLGAGPAGLTWTLSGMSIGLAVTLLTAGVLADDYGHRRVFALGLVVLGVAAAVGAAAPHIGVVIAARVVEGIGGAAVLAGGLGMIGRAYGAGPGRARATAIWGAAVGAGTGLGGIAAVVLDHGAGSWRVTYAVSAVAAFVLAVVAVRLLPESTVTRSRPVDVAGVLLLGGGIGALLAGLVDGRTGWTAEPIGLVAVGVALLVAFVVVEARRTTPLIDLALFRVRGFAAATVGALMAGAALIGVMSYVPTVLQRGLGASLPSAMVLMLIWSAVGTGTSWLLRRAHAVSGRALLAGALAVSAVGLLGLVVLVPGASEWRLLPGLVVLGVGYGAVNAGLGREAIAHLPVARAGMGSGTNNTARYVGSALGVTITAVLAVPTAPTPVLLRGFDVALLGGAVLAAVGAAVVVVLGRPSQVVAVAPVRDAAERPAAVACAPATGTSVG